MDQTKRLDSLLSDLGFCARRKVENYLHANTVTINGTRITTPGIRVNLQTDKLVVNGKEQKLKETPEELIYYALNKPKGVVSAVSDNTRKKTVTAFLPRGKRVFPVGRLDELSTGLILVTNDGDLAHKLTHPRYHIPKTYLVWVVGTPSEKRLDRIREGMILKEGKLKPVGVTILKTTPKRTLIEIILNEGKNHQIRRMCARVGINIVELKRVSIGPVNLNFLGLGKYRTLTEKEINDLKSAVAEQQTNSTQQ